MMSSSLPSSSNRVVVVGDSRVGKAHVIKALFGNDKSISESISLYSLPSVRRYQTPLTTKYYSASIEIIVLPHSLSTINNLLTNESEILLWKTLLESCQVLLFIYDRNNVDASFSVSVREKWSQLINELSSPPDCMIVISNATKSIYSSSNTPNASSIIDGKNESLSSPSSSATSSLSALALEGEREEIIHNWCLDNNIEYVYVSYDDDKSRQLIEQKDFIVKQGGVWDEREKRQMDRIIEAIQCAQWPQMNRNDGGSTAGNALFNIGAEYENDDAEEDIDEIIDEIPEGYQEMDDGIGGQQGLSMALKETEEKKIKDSIDDEKTLKSKADDNTESKESISENDADRIGDESESIEAMEQLIAKMRTLRSSAQTGNMSDNDRRHQAENLIRMLMEMAGDDDDHQDDDIQ